MLLVVESLEQADGCCLRVFGVTKVVVLMDVKAVQGCGWALATSRPQPLATWMNLKAISKAV